MRGILGADVFINLLLVFIIATGLLLMNTNKVCEKNQNKPLEFDFPSIQLPEGTSIGDPGSLKKRQVTISAKMESNSILYFIDETPVELNSIPAKLKSKPVESVKIRFDNRIIYGQYVEVLDICKQAGVKEIINVYTGKNQRK